MDTNNEYDQSLDWLEQLDPGDELSEGDGIPRLRNAPEGKPPRRGRMRPAQHQPKKSESALISEIAEKDDALVFSYQAKRHEEQWIRHSLTGFYRMGWFDDILRQIKGGKEASVYQCKGNATSGEDYIAAKIYRPKMFRNLRNDHMYRVGRKMLDSQGEVIKKQRELKAIHNRTDFGESLIRDSWIEHEFQSLQRLHAAGAPIPTPYARGSGAILMGYIGGPLMPAPTLNTVTLETRAARRLFDECIQVIELMLNLDLIHGDFSAYNILYWEGAITVIDFPQVVEPGINPNAYDIFRRDVLRICEYFATQGIESDPAGLARAMWLQHRHSVAPPVLQEPVDEEDEDVEEEWEEEDVPD